jgi:branched-chain amino acid transport system substrate-binding protein
MKRTLVLLGWAAVFLLAFSPPVVHAADTVKVAAIFAKTGDAATPNLNYFYGARMAVDVINRKGGLLGRSVELIEIDTRAGPGLQGRAVQAVKQKVTAVIGGARSSMPWPWRRCSRRRSSPENHPPTTMP